MFEAPAWEESLNVLEFDEKNKVLVSQSSKKEMCSDIENIYLATVIGLRDYVEKNSFPGVILGLSGGIDSALCAVIAVDALGEERVSSFMLPSIYTSDESFTDSKECAKRLGISLETISIEKTFESINRSLEKTFKGYSEDITEENLQSRIRGTLLTVSYTHLTLPTKA